MITSKPYISGSYQQESFAGYHHDTPLFSLWTVGWTETASCGHESCGEDWVDERFVTWEEAYNYALALVA